MKTARDAGITAAGARFRTVLVAAQIAVALALSVAAGLLLRSFTRLTAVDTGFERRDVVLAQVTLAGSRYEPERWSAYVERAVSELRNLPGVAAAGAASPLPLSGQQGLLRFGVRFPGRPAPIDGRSDRTYLRWATPGYFDAIGIPLTAGRPFDSRDTRQAAAVAVIDRTFADRYFTGEDAVGRELQMSNEKTPRRIVGVVGAVRPVSLDQQAEPHVYVPQSQNASPVMTFVVRSQGDPRPLQHAVRRRLLEVDPGKPVYNVRTAEEMIDATLTQRKMNTWLMALFASAAGTLSAIGMYGLMAGWVNASRREIGVRLALGARRGEVLRMILRRAAAVTVAGVVAGIPLAYAGTGLVRSLLFEVVPRDAVSLASACLLLLGVGLAGAVVPAKRAIDMNPVDTLRSE